MTWIDYFLVGFIFNLVFLPFVAIRYDLLKVRTTLQSEFTTRKVNEFIAYNIVFSLASFLTDALLIVHMCHRKYMQYLTGKYGGEASVSSSNDIPQISTSFDLTGVPKKKKR